MKAIKMLALAFFASLFVVACEPAGDAGNQPQEPAAPSGGMGAPQ